MRRLVIYSDCHLDAPHSVLKENPEIKSELFNKEMVKLKYKADDVFLTGDIIDIDNCHRKKLSLVKDRMFRLLAEHGDNYILGNHECMTPERYFVKYGNVLLTHGHALFWNQKKISKWENKKGGMKWWRYKIYQLTHHSGRSGKALKLSGEKAAEIASLTKEMGCDTIIFGHTHRVFDEKYAGVRIINVPKGRTIVEIE